MDRARTPRSEGESRSRAEAAEQRAAELRSRLQDLDRGVPAGPDAAVRAQQHADEALLRAQRAHAASAERHGDASRAHLRAAALHEQVALGAADEDVAGHQDAAQRHRDDAKRHDAAAAADLLAEEDDARRAD